MKQRAHSWVALRALKLIDDSKKAPKLVELLSYYLSDVWEGAWLPDTLIVDMKYGHIFKLDNDPEMLGYDITKYDWRRVSYDELDDRLCGKRLCLEYIKDSKELQDPYWIHEKYSGHLPDRVIAISHTIGDMLKMSDYPMAFYAKKKRSRAYMEEDLSKQNIRDLSLSPNFSARQIAIMFFIISHYICDAHMPLHCDLRDYGGKKLKRRLPRSLHPSIEKLWESQFPEKEKIILHDYTIKSLDDITQDLPGQSIIEIDTNPEYKLNKRIFKIKGDEWNEMVYTCRISYALSRKWITKPYDKVDKFIDDIGDDEFKRVTNYIFHDTVESIARIWYKTWIRFIE